MRVAWLLLLLSPAALAEECRVLINYSGPGRHVLDVTVGPNPSVLAYAGLAAGEGEQVFQLDLTQEDAHVKGKLGGCDLEWDTLHLYGARGAPTILAGGVPEATLPEEEGFGDFYASQSLEVTGIFGPLVGISVGTGGFSGGAHGYDNTEDSTLDVRTGQTTPLEEIIGVDLLPAAKRVVAEARAAGEVSSPVEVSAAELSHAALRLHGADELVVEDTVFCCSWAENHNMFPLQVPVRPVPPRLRALVADKDGWFEGPCGAVREIEEGIEVRVGDKRTRLRAPSGHGLLGVAWISKGAPKLRALPKLPTQSARGDAYKKAMAEGRALMKSDPSGAAGRFKDALRFTEGAPDRAVQARVEAGWALFQGKDLAEAKATLEAALVSEEHAPNTIRGMLHYNLGRVLEAQGDVEGARARYGRSLQLRPHPAVSKRLRALPPPKPGD